MATEYYIHMHDPTFFEPPWPGQRRLGPFKTRQSAINQAASDIAIGAGESYLGIWTSNQSDQMREDDTNPTPDEMRDRASVTTLVESVEPSVPIEELKDLAAKINADRIQKASESPSIDEGDAMRAVLESTGIEASDNLVRDLLYAGRLIG